MHSSTDAEVKKSTEGQSTLWKAVILKTGNTSVANWQSITEPGCAILTSAGQSM